MSGDNGGPAFPVPEGRAKDGAGGWWGMDLRDYLAAKAMQGFIPLWANAEDNIDCLAETSYNAADAMLKARQQ